MKYGMAAADGVAAAYSCHCLSACHLTVPSLLMMRAERLGAEDGLLPPAYARWNDGRHRRESTVDGRRRSSEADLGWGCLCGSAMVCTYRTVFQMARTTRDWPAP